MIYTLKDYTQDKKTAAYTFRKYIGKHYLKDELIHIATTKLWLVRLEHGRVCRPIETAKNAMLNFLRQEQKYCNHDSLYDNTDEADLLLLDILAINQPTAQDWCEYQDLLERITPLSKYMSRRDKRIISLSLKHYTQREIAARLGLSQPYVNEIIKNFREAARQVLD